MSRTLPSYLMGSWRAGSGPGRTLHDATTEEVLATCSTEGLDLEGALAYARSTGGPALRALTFAQRGALLKRMAALLHEHREEFLDISLANNGTTRSDGKFDIDGATLALTAYGDLGEALGPRRILADGEGAAIGRGGRFWGQHAFFPRHGVAVHVNAFNFPAWNMMEKLACAVLAGMPVVEKPGTPTALLAWRMAEVVQGAGILPEGTFQILVGDVRDLLDALGPQDVVAFTGSGATAVTLRSHPAVVRHNVRLNVEADSLNAAVLGPDLEVGSETFALFVKYVTVDIRQKTGQKCTAVRRLLVPRDRAQDAAGALVDALGAIVTGDPRESETTMGPLASARQLVDVRDGIQALAERAEVLTGGPEPVRRTGYFVRPTLLMAKGSGHEIFHEREVFGPVATILPYDGTPEGAADLVARAQGCLVASLYSDDTAFAEEAIERLAPWNGRLWIGSEKMAAQSLPPGIVLPSMTHGGPGRAGGGEELGGLRGLLPYLQRTALQGYRGLLAPMLSPPETQAVH